MSPLLPAIGIGAALVTASLTGCNERFDFDVPTLDSAEEMPGDSAGVPTGADSGSLDSATTASSTTAGGSPAESGARCAADADCRLVSLHCHPELGRCVECVDDRHCSNPDSAHCDLELFRCVACTEDSHCAQGSRCDPSERRCALRCATMQDCVDAHACNDGVCVACDRDIECRTSDASAPVCSASGLRCASCREDAQCPPLEVCDALSGRCVSCLSSDDCGDGMVCDPVLLECVTG